MARASEMMDEETGHIQSSFLHSNYSDVSNDEQEVDGSSIRTCRGKKRKINSDNWKRNIAKRERNRGKSYVSLTTGKEVKKKIFRHVNKCCRKRCFEALNNEEQRDCFKSFWDIGDKILQDTVLLGYMKRKEKIFQKQERAKERNNLWCYSIKVKNDDKPICRQFLLSVLQISEMRLRTVQHSLKTGGVLEERRGKHTNRPNKITENVWQLVEEHWKQIPHKEAHYSRAKTARKYFENPELSVVKLYNAFKQYFYDRTGKPLEMGYSAYHKYFRENSEYSFRQPRTDTCDYCAECEASLKANPDSECKILFKCHQKKVEAYNKIKSDIMTDVGNDSSDLLVLEFDYAQNLPLPRLSITAQFYKRLLWLYTFNVHCHNDGSSTFYCFLESESKKNPNSVCSFLYDFIVHKLERMPNKKKIILLSDSCGGQNKNIVMTMFCTWLSKFLKVDIEHLFPVRGHSFSQCDRNFGKYGMLLKQVENIQTAEEYINIMRISRKCPEPFVSGMSASLIKDWASALKPLFLRVPTAKGYKFSIQKYVRLHYKNGIVSGSQTYFSNFQPFVFIDKKVNFLSYNDLKLSNVTKPGVKAQKRADVLSLAKYLKHENVEWYEKVLCVSRESESSVSDSDCNNAE